MSSNLFFEIDAEAVDPELTPMLDGSDCVKSVVRSLPDADQVFEDFEYPEIKSFRTPTVRRLGNSPMTEFDFGSGDVIRVKTEAYEKATPERRQAIEMQLRKSFE